MKGADAWMKLNLRVPLVWLCLSVFLALFLSGESGLFPGVLCRAIERVRFFGTGSWQQPPLLF